ncbi:MAG TPA: hypothetical protein IAD39_04645, partial [Candidatus Merdisoma faecalis]|nr:hypothetical protein [Candidatus Merdisoma faecalis]
RTIAMDFWASVDHQLKYKKDVENPEEVSKELKDCADIIAQMDTRMLAIKDKIYSGNRHTETVEEKLRKLNISLGGNRDYN